MRKNGVKGLVTSIDTYNIIIIFKGIGYRFYTYNISYWYTYVYDYFLMVLLKINIFY